MNIIKNIIQEIKTKESKNYQLIKEKIIFISEKPEYKNFSLKKEEETNILKEHFENTIELFLLNLKSYQTKDELDKENETLEKLDFTWNKLDINTAKTVDRLLHEVSVLLYK